MEQRTPEWHAARCGKVTASRVADVIAKTKSGPSASRTTYMGQLLAERLTGVQAEGYANDAMRWGTEQEPEARLAYEFATEAELTEVGFIDHPRIAMAGASPDGLIGDVGLVELKCPNTATHVDTILGGAIPAKYVTQMAWQMAVTGRAYCDFASFDPRLPPEHRLFVKRLHRDDALIADLEREVSTFIAELDAKLAALSGLRRAA